MLKSFLTHTQKSATTSWSNDGAITGTGGSREFLGIKHPSICKVKERVCIDIFAAEYRVREYFTFTNRGDATIAMMRFPEHGGRVHPDPTYFRSHSVYTNFTEKVDGHLVSDKRVVLKQTNGEDYAAYRVKTIPFAQGETHEIRMEYLTHPEFMSMGGYGVEYAFTGDDWQGTVELSTLEVNFHLAGRPTSYSAIFPGQREPTTQLATSSRICYSWENWEAAGSFHLSYYAAPAYRVTSNNRTQIAGLFSPLLHASASVAHLSGSCRDAVKRLFAS